MSAILTSLYGESDNLAGNRAATFFIFLFVALYGFLEQTRLLLADFYLATRLESKLWDLSIVQKYSLPLGELLVSDYQLLQSSFGQLF